MTPATYLTEVLAWADLEAITGRGSARHTLDGRIVGDATDQLDLLADRCAGIGWRRAEDVAARASVQVRSDAP